MKKWVTKFVRLRGDNHGELGKRINEFLEENGNLEDFEIVDIQYGKEEKCFKGTDPRAANIIYRYRETVNVNVINRIDGEEL